MFASLDIWIFAFLNFAFLHIRILGCLDVWMFACLDVCMFAFLDVSILA